MFLTVKNLLSILHLLIKVFFTIAFCLIICFLYFSIKILHYSNTVNKLTQAKASNIDFSKHIKKLEEEASFAEKSSFFYKDKISKLHHFLVLKNSNISTRRPAVGGAETIKIKEKDKNSIQYLEEYINDMKINNELLKDISKVLEKKQAVTRNIPSIWPVKEGYILYPFGVFFDPISGNFTDNKGVGISTSPNEEVSATAPGIISKIIFEENYGYTVIVQHKYSWKTTYKNIKRVFIKEGDKVDRKTVIGLVGKTKFNPNYYLDYKISIGTKIVNPFHFLSSIPN